MTKGQQAIQDVAGAMRDTTGNLPMLPGIFPDYSAPIVRTVGDGVRELVIARWGMPSPVFALQVKKVDRCATNVRNTTSPHWRRTSEPNAGVAAVHPKAMPVVLEADDIETWLTAPWAEASRLQRPLPGGALKIIARGERFDGIADDDVSAGTASPS